MKTIFIIISGFLFISFINNTCAQSGNRWNSTNFYQDTTLFYKDCKSQGEYLNGVKIGKWREISPKGIIYAESTYDSLGKPTGTWIINFPDGTIRRITRYSELGVINWSVYRYKTKLLDVYSDPIIENNICETLNNYETTLFESEKVVCSSRDVYYDYGYSLSGTENSKIDPYFFSVSICEKLKLEKFTGTLYIYNSDNTIRRKCIYTKGSEYRTSYFYNGKKTLIQQDEYKDDTIIRTVKFKKNGTEKVKTYL